MTRKIDVPQDIALELDFFQSVLDRIADADDPAEPAFLHNGQLAHSPPGHFSHHLLHAVLGGAGDYARSHKILGFQFEQGGRHILPNLGRYPAPTGFRPVCPSRLTTTAPMRSSIMRPMTMCIDARGDTATTRLPLFSRIALTFIAPPSRSVYGAAIPRPYGWWRAGSYWRRIPSSRAGRRRGRRSRCGGFGGSDS